MCNKAQWQNYYKTEEEMHLKKQSVGTIAGAWMAARARHSWFQGTHLRAQLSPSAMGGTPLGKHIQER